jgi:lysyl-tRNA synthetase class 2
VSTPLDELRAAREEKVRAMRARGIEPYAYDYAVTHHAADVTAAFDRLSESGDVVRVAGRLMARRGHGKASFGDIADWSGSIQIYVKSDVVGMESYDVFQSLLDVGDMVGVEGTVFRTKMGEITIQVVRVTPLAKALRPLPEKWHGLVDREVRRRQRYVDLIMNPDARRVARARVAAVRALRAFLDARGFMEVETPVLQPIYGGAAAEPFTTHHNALETTLYLRIADELYLKRCIVAGMERVYEIAKDFRNEGMDWSHSPEFTMLEVYQAYADYTDVMSLAEEMLRHVTQEVTGALLMHKGDTTIDIGQPWRRVTMTQAVSNVLGMDASGATAAQLRAAGASRSVTVADDASWGETLFTLFEECVEHTLVTPTIVLDYPIEISPLAKVHRTDARLVERFEIFIGGTEMGNAFSEQNDPHAQAEAFDAQGARAARGDAEAHQRDDDYVRALEHGMPPTGGFGLGVDRLVMMLTGVTNIRDVILFPLLRPRPADASPDDNAVADDPTAPLENTPLRRG